CRNTSPRCGPSMRRGAWSRQRKRPRGNARRGPGVGSFMTQRIIRCTARHLDRMLDYVAANNPAGEHHIGYFGVTPEDIRQSVLMLNLRYDRGFRLALTGNEITGAMGVDFDRAIGRAWLYGP